MSSIENIVDEAAHVAVLDSKGCIRRKGGQGGAAIGIKDAKDVDWSTLWNEGTDAVMDVPVGGVCRYSMDERRRCSSHGSQIMITAGSFGAWHDTTVNHQGHQRQAGCA